MSVLGVYDGPALLPDAWTALNNGPVWAFNPGLLRLESGWLMAYRIVGGDGQRRIGLCRLTPGFEVIQSTRTALSDAIMLPPGSNIPRWFADPRQVRLGGSIFLQWNSGWHEPQNAQFLQQLDVDAMGPIGPARELHLIGPRRVIEKNWMLFGNDPYFAVYSVCPHRILTFSLDTHGGIDCLEVEGTAWIDSYADLFGEIRGGAPPIRDGDGFVSFCHSVYGEAGDYAYEATAYRFATAFPFRPTHVPFSTLPLMSGSAFPRRLPPLNPEIRTVIYPVGAQLDGDRWIISLGLDDERCAIVALTRSEVSAILKPVTI